MNTVYGTYGQRELDLQYDQSSLVPDFAKVTSEWLEQSTIARRQLGGELDVPYGAHPSERIDIFSAGTPNAPAFAVFHGGAWRGLSKEHFSIAAPSLLAAGISVVVVGFSLATAVPLDVQVHQARSALAWLYGNADAYGIDRDRLCVAGHSSGAHLAALLATTDWSRWRLPANLVKGAALLSGIYDLRPVRLSSRNQYLNLDAAAEQRLSPIRLLVREHAVPIAVAWASGELDEFRRQGREFAEQCAGIGWPVNFFQIEGSNHFTVVESMTSADGKMLTAMKALAAGST